MLAHRISLQDQVRMPQTEPRGLPPPTLTRYANPARIKDLRVQIERISDSDFVEASFLAEQAGW